MNIPTPSTNFADALAFAEQEYKRQRQWNTDARPQEERRADLLREIASHYNYGVAFLDRKQYRKEYERAIRKRNRARILLEELLERATAYYDAQHAAQETAQTAIQQTTLTPNTNRRKNHSIHNSTHYICTPTATTVQRV